MVQDRNRKFVVHHDQLLICNDRFIPLWMRKLRQEFLDFDETLPYDEAELEELNLFEAPPEVGIKDLFGNRVKYSNSDTNSRESGDYESDWDAGPLTTSGGLVPNDVVGDPREGGGGGGGGYAMQEQWGVCVGGGSHRGSASCGTSWFGHSGCGLCAPSLPHSSRD